MERERDVAMLAVVLDPLDQQFQHAALAGETIVISSSIARPIALPYLSSVCRSSCVVWTCFVKRARSS